LIILRLNGARKTPQSHPHGKKLSFFAFLTAVRKTIHTTKDIESLNRVIRKTTKTRGSFLRMTQPQS
jgi:transposase-like protein